MNEGEVRAELPSSWPAETKDVYRALQTYRIVGASACVRAIMRALRALAEVQPGDSRTLYRDLSAAGARFCALKPSTAAYVNVVQWLLGGLSEESDDRHVTAIVAARIAGYASYSQRSLDRIVDEACRLLAASGQVLIHDYSSTVLAILTEAGRRGAVLTVYLTAGEPVQQGPKVARMVASAGHRIVYLPDAGVGRVMGEVDVVLSGVETLFRDGDLANTVGTYPICLVAREAGVPVYGVTERMKIHHSARAVAVQDLTARVLHPWPSGAPDLPAGTEIRREVLDLTPAVLITGYITEVGVIRPSQVSGAVDKLYEDLIAATDA